LPSRGATSFGSNEQALYLNYDTIAAAYPGWNLSEIRQMSNRQRTYWLNLIKWRRDRARV
jgi:hypothetical protein